MSARTVASATEPGYHCDGAGLYLQVSPSGTKSWIFRFALHGRAREMGLGALATTSLAQARAKAHECRKLLHDGVDPIEARRAERAAARLSAAKAMTFDACAQAYIAAHEGGWRNEKHRAQWASTLAAYATPVFGALPVQAIDTGMVMKALEPIWGTKTETASRLRGRVEVVLDWATVRGYRTGENPACWRGHLDHLLPGRAKVAKVVHHAALPYDEAGAFMALLRAQAGVAARGVEFQVLTAARTGEVIGALWGEFDEAKRLWTVPAERMKAGRAHRVALSGRALEVLAAMRAASQSEFVFPGLRPGKPLSNMAFLQVIERLGRCDLTAHGFRSTFRDWAAERTAYAREVVTGSAARRRRPAGAPTGHRPMRLPPGAGGRTRPRR